MDPSSIVLWLTAAKSAVSTIKQVVDMLPDGAEKERATTDLADAEHRFKAAEAQTAQELGYQLCRNHWPPAVMLSEDGTHWRCSDPECKGTADTGPAIVTIERF